MIKYKYLVILVCIFFSQATCAGKVQVIKEGSGEIGIKGLNNEGWLESFSFPITGRSYSIKRLEQEAYPEVNPDILKTWEPQHFTNLKSYKKGENLTSFRFIVHGLELEHMVEGLNEATSFDHFVKRRLNPEVPLADNFIRFYPYFFHKKTIISASVISENLTASFGNVGFILTVPPENLIMSSTEDIHAPVDDYFYETLKSQVHSSKGETMMHAYLTQHLLMSLENLLPSEEVIVEGAVRPIPPKPIKITEQYIKETWRLGGLPEEVISRLPLSSFPTEAQQPTPTFDPFTSRIINHTSWYNEIAINPSRRKEGSNTYVKISGIFLRTSRECWQEFKTRPYVKSLWSIAKAFDLPVVWIDDGNEYETAV
jgi:hypothetical protein